MTPDEFRRAGHDLIDARMRAFAQAINDSGESFLTPALLDGRWAVRVSLGGANTEQEYVTALWRLMQQKIAT
jgi:aromatic-L-amino-acid/L-tryptophan decarboxylase